MLINDGERWTVIDLQHGEKLLKITCFEFRRMTFECRTFVVGYPCTRIYQGAFPFPRSNIMVGDGWAVWYNGLS